MHSVSGSLLWFPLSFLVPRLLTENCISQRDCRTWDLPSFTFSLSRNSWGKAVLLFLQGWGVCGNESLSLNNSAWNALSFPNPSFASCLLLPTRCKCSKAFSFVCMVLTRWFSPAKNFQPDSLMAVRQQAHSAISS